MRAGPGSLTALLVLGVCLATLTPAVAGEEDDPSPGIVIEGVIVTPDPPEPGEQFSAHVTIHNPTESRFEVTSVTLSNGTDDPTHLGSVVPPGLLFPGGQKTVRVNATVATAGTHRFRVRVTARTDAGKRTSLEYQFPVLIGGEHPELGISAPRAFATVEGAVTVTVANGLDTGIRNLRVTLSGDSVPAGRDRHVRGELASGHSDSFEFPVVPPKPGVTRVIASLSYTDPEGTRRTLREEASITVAPRGDLPAPDLAIETTELYAGIEEAAVIALYNGRSEAIRGIEVRVKSESLGAHPERRLRSRLDGGERATFEIPIVARSSGIANLTAEISYVDPDGRRRTIRRNETVRVAPAVEMPVPGVTIEANRTVVGVQSRMTVNVGNGLDSPVRNVAVRLQGDAFETHEPVRVRPRIEAGESGDFPFTVSPKSPGEHYLTAIVNVTVGNARRSSSHTVRIQAVPLRERIDLEPQVVAGGSRIAVDVFNLGNTPIEDVVVEGAASNVTISTSLLETVPPGESRTAIANLSRVRTWGRVPVEFVASYVVGDRVGRVTETVPLSLHLGTVELTGVRVEREGDELHVSGSASNVGLTAVDGVLVSVGDTERVDPAPPNRDYFVGTIPPSDFVSFDLDATAPANVSEIPVRVSYLVEGERRSTVIAVQSPVTGRSEVELSRDGSGGPSFLIVGGFGVIVVGVVGGIVYLGWRNRDA